MNDALITAHVIGLGHSQEGHTTFQAVDPTTRQVLPGEFVQATAAEVEAAVSKAHAAWSVFAHLPGAQRAIFLRAIAEEIEALGDSLIQRASQESGLPAGRLLGERGRTVGQLRLFAQLLDEGSWVEAVIDPTQPDRQPQPRPDLRRMLHALGPVVVFTASNFPLAFSTAGGDTAAALAAGCPVVVKAHESHPGTHALVAGAVQRAAQRTAMPDGVFSALLAADHSVGQQLVQHPLVSAVAFTGSQRGGLALHRLANERDTPIPVFAEMGSTNPIFLLPQRVKEATAALAHQLATSVNLGAGQFCTNPGLIFLIENEDYPGFIAALAAAFGEQPHQTMLNEGIHQHYHERLQECVQQAGVAVQSDHLSRPDDWTGTPTLATVSLTDFLQRPTLHREVFGPYSLVVGCADVSALQTAAAALEGQLTASLMGTEAELAEAHALADLLRDRVGRLIYNGVPTGVEVGYAMQHGGPYPATTDSRFTSVGTGAIRRFVRPVAYQDCPAALLPPALQDHNPLGIWRWVDGQLTQQ